MKLQLHSVSKQFTSKSGEHTALRDITLDVKPGEFVCIVGPSGCGKSTILNLLSGIEQPTSGTMTVEGKIGFMFQEAGLFPWLNVSENISFGLRMRKQSKVEIAQRVQDSVDLVHLQGFELSQPHQLSGGMKQRTALARTLVLDPDILLMDEPFGALDAQTREHLQKELQHIWQTTKKTIVFITHDIREAVVLGDRVLVMGAQPGRIVAEHTIALTHPRDMNDPQVSLLAKQIQSELEQIKNDTK